jgi:hypothetical protein
MKKKKFKRIKVYLEIEFKVASDPSLYGGFEEVKGFLQEQIAEADSQNGEELFHKSETPFGLDINLPDDGIKVWPNLSALLKDRMLDALASHGKKKKKKDEAP